MYITNKLRRKGFTLIELLVVISIIGILASLALVSYSGAQKQARDTQRRSDLAQYRNSLETYAASNGSVFPTQATAANVSGICPSILTTSYIASCPSDPTSTVTGYGYYYWSDAVDYALWAKLETGGYWELCSSGKSGKASSAPTSTCNLP